MLAHISLALVRSTVNGSVTKGWGVVRGEARMYGRCGAVITGLTTTDTCIMFPVCVLVDITALCFTVRLGHVMKDEQFL